MQKPGVYCRVILYSIVFQSHHQHHTTNASISKLYGQNCAALFTNFTAHANQSNIIHHHHQFIILANVYLSGLNYQYSYSYTLPPYICVCCSYFHFTSSLFPAGQLVFSTELCELARAIS